MSGKEHKGWKITPVIMPRIYISLLINSSFLLHPERRRPKRVSLSLPRRYTFSYTDPGLSLFLFSPSPFFRRSPCSPSLPFLSPLFRTPQIPINFIQMSLSKFGIYLDQKKEGKENCWAEGECIPSSPGSTGLVSPVVLGENMVQSFPLSPTEGSP